MMFLVSYLVLICFAKQPPPLLFIITWLIPFPPDKQESGISGSTFPHVDQLMDDLPRCEKSLVCEKATGTDKLIVDISRPNDELTFDWTPRKRCAAYVRKAGQLIYLAAVRDNQTEIAESIVNVVKYLDYRCVIWKAGNEFRGIFEDCDPANTER